MEGLDPNQQIHGLLETINLDDDYIMREFPSLQMLLTNGITVVGPVAGPGGPYHDPTFDQYAVICKKPKALNVMLEMMVGEVDWDIILYPKYSNTKLDLFALAAKTGSDACMKVLLDRAPSVNWARPGGPTPLESAVKSAGRDDWGAVTGLLEKGASWTVELAGNECTLIRLLKDCPAKVQGLYDQIPEVKAAIDNAVQGKRWRAVGPGRQIMLSSDGRDLPTVWGQAFNEELVAQRLLQRIQPEVIRGENVNPDRQPPPAVPAPAPPPPAHCARCDREAPLQECGGCYQVFCQECLDPDNHDCEGAN
jgi:hypothetical protein